MIRMFRYTLFGVLIGCFLADVTGCNKKCKNVEASPSSLVSEEQIISDIVKTINQICKETEEEGNPLCNHMASVPAGTFSDNQLNITLKYTDIVLDSKETQLNSNDGLLTASVSFSYSNLILTVDDHDYKITLNVTDNHFDISFTLRMPTDKEQMGECFFEWNKIQVDKFEFSTATLGPDDLTHPVVKNFKKDNLQNIFNSKTFLDYLNKEMSVCNKESFLHEITGTFILLVALKGLESLFDNVFNNNCF